MPALIRLDTSESTLARRNTIDRPRSSSIHAPDDAAQPSSPPAPSASTSPLGRLRRKITLTTHIPLRRLNTHKPSTSLSSHREVDENPPGAPTATGVPSRVRIVISPIDRFRYIVRKVIISNRLKADPGNEDPGLDARRRSTYSLYGALHSDCTIDVVDYGAAKAEFTQLHNRSLGAFLADHTRPKWARVRWINITGLSWDVMSTLALQYDLHPLAVEDVFGGENLTISKADYYSQHLFLRVLCHVLRDEEAQEPKEEAKGHARPSSFGCETIPRDTSMENNEQGGDGLIVTSSSSRPQFERQDSRAVRSLASAGLAGAQPWGAAEHDFHVSWAKSVYPDVQPIHTAMPRVRWRDRLAAMTPETMAREEDAALLELLKKGRRVKVDLRNLYIFQLRDGTVISIHPTAYPTFFEPILRRLKLSDTMIRANPDPSILTHALLDLVVDYAYDMVERFREQLFEFEKKVLDEGHTNIIRDVHIFSGDLKLLLRTLKPLRNLIRNLRMNDANKTSALAEDVEYVQKNIKHIQGYMSKQATTYLADVEDHVTYILECINQFAHISEEVLEYSFRRLRYATSLSMRSYTLAIVVFLPTMFVVQYFGMNFEINPSFLSHPVSLFWTVAPCVLILVLLLFTWPFFENWYHFLSKRLLEFRLIRLASP